MKHEIYILIIEDELEVMDALLKDLEQFEETFPLETANSAREAEEVVKQIYKDGNTIGLILCDHVLPGKNGVDFLIELEGEKEFQSIRKVLVTGQAGLEDTVQAINKAKLNHYIAKPWTKQELHSVVIDQLTELVISQKLNPLPFMSVLDTKRLATSIRDNPLMDH